VKLAKEEQPVGSKRKSEVSEENAKKKLKRTPPMTPPALRKLVQEFFKDKSVSNEADVMLFFQEQGVKKFSDFRMQERKFSDFIQEHNISWANGEVTGPSDEWLKQKLKEQMEFYFGEANLVRDTFLKNEIAKSDERWVTLELFKKFQMILKWVDHETLTTHLAAALSDSSTLELDDKKKNVRRKKKLKLTKWEHAKRITVVHGFKFAKGKRNLKYMKEHFSKYGRVDALFPKRPKGGKNIMGSIEIIWANAATAQEFRNNKTVKINEDTLTISQTVAEDSFKDCYSLKELALEEKEVKPYLKDLGLKPRRFTFTEDKKICYIWSQDKDLAVQKLKEIEEKDKKFSSFIQDIAEEQYELVFKLFDRFKVIKTHYNKKRRNQKQHKQQKN